MDRFKTPAKVIAVCTLMAAFLVAINWNSPRLRGVIGGIIFMAIVIVVWLWNRRGSNA